MDKRKSLYFPDSIEIASLEGLTLCCSEVNQTDGHWHGDARFSWLGDNDLPLHCRHSLTEGKTRHWLERYHFVVSTLALGLKINFNQPIKWMEFQKLAELKWLTVYL